MGVRALSKARSALLRGALLCTLAALAPAHGAPSAATAEAPAADPVERGRQVWKKAKCAFCHGWAGDGRGHPRSPGAAPSLRSSALDRAAMESVIRCGRPGTAMPYHDRKAWRERSCFGLEREDVDAQTLPPRGEPVRDQALPDLLEYIFAAIVGRDRATLAECEAYFKPGSRNCAGLQP